MRYFYSEGGFQEFTLGSAEWFWLIAAAATTGGAILAGIVLSRGGLAADACTEKLQEIAGALDLQQRHAVLDVQVDDLAHP